MRCQQFVFDGQETPGEKKQEIGKEKQLKKICYQSSNNDQHLIPRGISEAVEFTLQSVMCKDKELDLQLLSTVFYWNLFLRSVKYLPFALLSIDWSSHQWFWKKLG